MTKNYLVSNAGARTRIFYVNAQETMVISKLTVDNVQNPNSVYFEQDNQFINWGDIERRTGVKDAHKPYRLDILDNRFAFAYPNQDMIVVWNMDSN